jgi:hypothetical protein
MQKFKTPYEESQWESNSKVLPDGNPLLFAPKIKILVSTKEGSLNSKYFNRIDPLAHKTATSNFERSDQINKVSNDSLLNISNLDKSDRRVLHPRVSGQSSWRTGNFDSNNGYSKSCYDNTVNFSTPAKPPKTKKEKMDLILTVLNKSNDYYRQNKQSISFYESSEIFQNFSKEAKSGFNKTDVQNPSSIFSDSGDIFKRDSFYNEEVIVQNYNEIAEKNPSFENPERNSQEL